ncbi:MAG: ethanolamine ammonia-lyase subunit EutC [Hyphomicrobiaceae bacterium]|nr:ethanolamine ammonia-lyase subunit EutC [Hyphomicrobiaceae bacterium]
MTSDDIWARFVTLTPARIALGRAGSGLPTVETLKFALAHAQARDAVHATFAAADVAAQIEALELGVPILSAASRAASRQSYLLRPDLGRQLDADSREAIAARAPTHGCDVALVIADGLSATAINAHAAAMVAALEPHMKRHGWRLGPLVIVSQARVAIGDEIGALLGARLVLVMIGERPGLSSPDSLGLYLTYAPHPGRTDGERNCISNIRGAGMSVDEAAHRAAWLMREALLRGMTGVALKDESDGHLPASRNVARMITDAGQ